MEKYRARIADEILKKRLQGKGAVLITGPRGCGKTTTAEQVAGSALYMEDPESKDQNLMMADLCPKRLLQGQTPRLLDEWQHAPKLWDAVRFEVDHREGMGQFILTGSAVPASTRDIYHTGTGRFSRVSMRPMSLYESRDSTGEVSLRELFETPEQIDGGNPLDMDRLAFLVCRGGWPKAVELQQAYENFDSFSGITRNPERMKRLMKAYARNQGAQESKTKICADMAAHEGETLCRDTVSSYINALKNIFVIEELEAWHPVLRTKTAIRTSSRMYFMDPSIAVAALGLKSQDLPEDLKTFGMLFKALCIRDLKVYADALDGEVLHYRDKTGLECDAVIRLRKNGACGLAAIRLGGEAMIEEGVKTLGKLRDKLDTRRMKAPAFLMVMIGLGDYAYRRRDGVYVVPVGCLKN